MSKSPMSMLYGSSSICCVSLMSSVVSVALERSSCELSTSIPCEYQVGTVRIAVEEGSVGNGSFGIFLGSKCASCFFIMGSFSSGTRGSGLCTSCRASTSKLLLVEGFDELA